MKILVSYEEPQQAPPPAYSADCNSGVSAVAGATAAASGAFGTSAVFAAARFTTGLLGKAFFEETFLTAAFFAVTTTRFSAGTTCSSALAFVATAAFAETRFVTVFFATTFGDAVFDFLAATFPVADLLAAVEATVFAPPVAPSIKNLLRSFASAIQAGARPRPLQVAPLFGSRYFSG